MTIKDKLPSLPTDFNTTKGEKVASIVFYVESFDIDQLEGPRSIGMVRDHK
jgi:hypothetical protein